MADELQAISAFSVILASQRQSKRFHTVVMAVNSINLMAGKLKNFDSKKSL